MRHLPFLEILSGSNNEDAPAWRDAAAGYLVLRFFDRWLHDGPAMMASDPSLSVIRERIQVMSDVEARAQDLLLTVLQTMVSAAESNPVLVSDPLLAYGKYLESTGQLVLAADVYQTVIVELGPLQGEHPTPVTTALLYYGYVSRLLGDLQASTDAYQRAYAVAKHGDVVPLMLRAQIGQANTLRVRGNLGEAEALLDGVVAEARAAGVAEAELWALRSRGNVRVLRDRYVEALTDFLRAYELLGAHALSDEPSHRELLFGDIAACAAEAGYGRVARDLHHMIARTASTPTVRLAALVKLLELAASDGDAAEFERVRADIRAHAECHPVQTEHALHLALHTAAGVARFRGREEAVAAYRAVVAEARRVGMHHIAFKAEASLLELRAGNTSTPP